MHEIGHILALKITNKLLSLNYIVPWNCFTIKKNEKNEKKWFSSYSGRTNHIIYTYLSNNKSNDKILWLIRFNSIAGVVVETCILLIVQLIVLTLSLILKNDYILFVIIVTCIPMIQVFHNFFTGFDTNNGDIKHTTSPQTFSYP